MSLASINFLAVGVSALTAFIIGGVWYGPLFGKIWMRENGYTEDDLKDANMAQIYGTSFLLTVIIGLNLAYFLQGSAPDFVWGMTVGAMTGLGFASMSMALTDYLKENLSPSG